MRRFLGHVVLGLATMSMAGAAAADGYGSHEGRKYVRQAPVKDCTRLNGRYGYYGNPWCTAAEQARWDAWSARRHVALD